MNWLDRLNRRFGRFGIPYLMNAILIGQAAVWFVTMFVNARVYSLLTLNLAGLQHLQLWRLISFVFVPPLTTSVLGFAFYLYFLWWLGNALEHAWGDFRFTVFWLVGMIGAILGCLISGGGSTSGILFSLFCAYAWLWPDNQIFLFFFIPVKVKWIGWVAGGLWLLQLVGAILRLDLVSVCSLLFGLAGFLVFFGPELFFWCRDSIVSYKRRRDWKNKWK